MANQDDFEKLVTVMEQAETPNEFMNTLVTGLSTMLTGDINSAKNLYATEQQLQSLLDTQVNLDAHLSEFIDVLMHKIHSALIVSNSVGAEFLPVIERLAAQPPRSAAHAAVQGARGAEVMSPVPAEERPEEMPMEAKHDE